MANMKHSRKPERGEAKKSLIESLKILRKWLAQFQSVFQNNEITELQVRTYAEQLRNLTPEQLDHACFVALAKVSKFPAPADILDAFRELKETVLSGPGRPAYLDEPPPLTAEQREEALKLSAKLKETLAQKERELKHFNPPKGEITFDPSAAEEAIARYRIWLEEQSLLDKAYKDRGLPPLPRSHVERLAIFMSLPKEERDRLTHKADWAEISKALPGGSSAKIS